MSLNLIWISMRQPRNQPSDRQQLMLTRMKLRNSRSLRSKLSIGANLGISAGLGDGSYWAAPQILRGGIPTEANCPWSSRSDWKVSTLMEHPILLTRHLSQV